jgi:uncharacterized protein YgiM (DUF1202 family)
MITSNPSIKLINTQFKVIVVILLWGMVIDLQAQHLHYPFTNRVFVDSANVRTEPTIKSKVIGKLSHGTIVQECHGEAVVKDQVGGVEGYWKPIQYANGIGYIWDQILANGYFKSQEYVDDVFMVKQSAKNKLDVKVFRKNVCIYSTSFERHEKQEIIGSTSLGITYNSYGKEVIAIAVTKPEIGNLESYLLFTWNGHTLESADFKLNDDSFITEQYHSFTDGIINTNKVNIRKEPNTASKVVQIVNQFERVKIDSLYCKYERDGEENKYWHKITVNKKTGYILSDYLDVPIRYMKSNKNQDESFLYTNWAIYVFRKDTIADIKRFTFMDHVDIGADYNNHFINFGHRGLRATYQIIGVCHRAYSCGHWSGDELYVWDGHALVNLGNDGGVGDGALSEGVSLTFPTDIGGVYGKIIENEYAAESINDISMGSCQETYAFIYEYDITRHLTYTDNALREVPSRDYYLKKYLHQQYPTYDLMKCTFSDLNGDSIEDAVFVLHTRDYDKKEHTRQIIGIAYGSSDTSHFEGIKVNTSLLKGNVLNHVVITPDKYIEIWLMENMGYQSSNYDNTLVQKYVFRVASENQVIWQSIAEKWGKYRNYDIKWNEEEIHFFKTKTITFENAWKYNE